MQIPLPVEKNDRATGVEFVFIAESGTLEKQSLLLCESIRRFGGRYADADIKILQPRRERTISKEGREQFHALRAEIMDLPVVSPCPEYGTGYRVMVCAVYEKYSQADCLVFLDSDSVILAEPDLELKGADVAARPVDIKGMCTTGEGDPNDVYWRELCGVCGVDYEQIPEVTTTVDRVRIKASYNGGLTVVKPQRGLFQKTADFFLRSIRENLAPWPDVRTAFPTGHGMVSAVGGRLWGSSQACMSLAITALGLSLRVLPPSLNFPLHSYVELLPTIANGEYPHISHVHYHHLFRGNHCDNPMFAGKLDVPKEAIAWLRANTEKFA